MQIAENNWVRRIGKVTQEDRRKMKELREETGMTKQEWVKTDCQKEHGKQKRVAEEEEEDQSCDEKTVSNEIWKGQVRTAKTGRPQQKIEGDGEH